MRDGNGSPIARRRRRLLARAAALTGLATLNVTLAIRNVLAMSNAPPVPGIRTLEGTITVNGRPGKVGDLVNPGDTLVTGPESQAIVVHNRDALLIRADTTVKVDSGDSTFLNLMRITAGAVLSVWGPREQPLGIQTPIASIGIRGTGIYVDSRDEYTYACTCYGVADLVPVAAPGKQRSVQTVYHDAPFFIYAKPDEPFVEAPVINHTDEELILLESLFFRVPPFTEHPNYSGNGY